MECWPSSMVLALLAMLALCAAVATSPAEPPAPTPASRPATTTTTSSPFGSRGVRIHDPSGIVRCNGAYWVFFTGQGVPSYRSKDLLHWSAGPRVFGQQPPAWVRDVVPANRNGNDFWAPDVIRLDGRYLLYYSVSAWGKNRSAIALATNRTLDPDEPAYHWVDEGVVIRSTPDVDDFNAIDPAASLDADGRLWLAFGSFWGGIKMVELDRHTGQRVAPDSPVHTLAYKKQIEGPYVYRHGDNYYLFVNWGWCCRGTASTYEVRVGRSHAITGPYVDREGVDLRVGGGTLVLDTDGPFVGPGQFSVLDDDGGRQYVACHFYDGTQRGRGMLAVRPLRWGDEGWPVVGAE